MRIATAIADTVRQMLIVTQSSVLRLLGLTKSGDTPGGGAAAGLSSSSSSGIEAVSIVVYSTELRQIEQATTSQREL